MTNDRSLFVVVSHPDHSGEIDTYHVSAGHLFVLRCLIADAHTNVTWSRGRRRNLSLPAGVEVRDGLLWFLPVQMSHNGSYTCEKRYRSACMTGFTSNPNCTKLLYEEQKSVFNILSMPFISVRVGEINRKTSLYNWMQLKSTTNYVLLKLIINSAVKQGGCS